MQADVVVVAAGKGRRLQSQFPKQFLPLAGKPILAHTLTVFDQHPRIENVIIVGAEDWLFYISTDVVEKFGIQKVKKIVAGGEERQQSVQAGVVALESKKKAVLVHDGVRPFVSIALIDRVLDGLPGADACIPALPSADTIKEIDGEWIKKTIARERLRCVQTPQAFLPEKLRGALQHAEQKSLYATDEAALIEHLRGKVRWVEGEPFNIKITTEFDLKMANLIMGEKN